jgi:hypothetical protein
MSASELTARLGSLTHHTPGQGLLLEKLYGDRPEVLEAVVAARRVNGASWQQIALLLSEDQGRQVSITAVRNYCQRNGAT